jgi:dTDP-4-amino-4,6-dideoxygalactose transaminase
MLMRVPIAKPFLDSAEEKAVLEVLRSGWVSQGPQCARFEEAVASFVGVPYARAVNSGTGALHLALLACGIGPGDEVVAPAFTCAATLNSIEFTGATPVLCDIELSSFALDPERIAQGLTPRTKAVVLVHLFGAPGRISQLQASTAGSGIILIEDAALSLGARFSGRAVGSFGKASFLSFHPRKMITTGEGGMVLTESSEVAEAVTALRGYGASVSALDRHNRELFELPTYERAGFNFKLTDLQASIGVEQMRKLPAIIERRRERAQRYHHAFKGLDWLSLPFDPPGSYHVYQSYTCLLRPDLHREQSVEKLSAVQRRFFRHLSDNGIASVQGAQSIPRLGYYRAKYGWVAEDYPMALIADHGTVCLPIYPSLSVEEQDAVIRAVRTFDPR